MGACQRNHWTSKTVRWWRVQDCGSKRLKGVLFLIVCVYILWSDWKNPFELETKVNHTGFSRNWPSCEDRSGVISHNLSLCSKWQNRHKSLETADVPHWAPTSLLRKSFNFILYYRRSKEHKEKERYITSFFFWNKERCITWWLEVCLLSSISHSEVFSNSTSVSILVVSNYAGYLGFIIYY